MDRVDDILAQWAHERPDLDTGPMGTLGRLKRVADRLVTGTTEVLAHHGLTPAGFDVLATLRRAGPPFRLSPGVLMDWTMVTSGTMTHRIDRLVADGLVTRAPDPQDGRSFLVALTPAGFDRVEAALADHVAQQHRQVAGLSDEQRAALDTILRDWLAALTPPRRDHD